MTTLERQCDELEDLLAHAGIDGADLSGVYEGIVSVLSSAVQDKGYESTTVGFLNAAQEMVDHSFPSWPMRGQRYDTSMQFPDEELPYRIARGVGSYLAVAMEKLSGHAKVGAKRIDAFIESSGLYTSDVRE
ncbi:hypothetical protein [Posidoniimonas corsicana]|uniref:hypothetical protein n=1 Tax=Posidoniimonas corsicana TaxID=1938618 RepID=UPI0011B692F7|nr:hypothetical protein [Posidoniimonas corsicana]